MKTPAAILEDRSRPLRIEEVDLADPGLGLAPRDQPAALSVMSAYRALSCVCGSAWRRNWCVASSVVVTVTLSGPAALTVVSGMSPLS